MNLPRFSLPSFFSLWVARNREFYRDKGALAWAFIVPVLIVMAVALAFSRQSEELFRVGVVKTAQDTAPISIALLNQSWITTIDYTDRDRALERVRHHQLDLLIEPAQGNNPAKYWINISSPRGTVMERLLHEEQPAMQRGEVSGRQVRYIDWVIPGVLAMNIMFGALFGVGYVIVRYRKNGVLKRLKATPVTALEFITAQIVSRLVIVMIVSSGIYAGCNYFLDFLMLGSYWLLFLVGALGGFSLVAMSLIISSRTASEEFAGGLMNVASYPMLLLSEVWFSLDNAPQWMRDAAQVLPLTHMIHAARRIMLEGATFTELSPELWGMAGISAALLVVAALLFRWDRA